MTPQQQTTSTASLKVARIRVGEFEPIVYMHPDFMIAGVILLVTTHLFELAARIQCENDLTV